MNEELQLLVGRLPGLEAAKKAIEEQITEICRRVAADTGDQGQANLAPVDPSVLGRDSLGRIVRKRTISPELKEKKRKLIAEARASKIAKLHVAHTTMVEPPAHAKTLPTSKPADEPGQHS
jgi:hypothetical protein